MDTMGKMKDVSLSHAEEGMYWEEDYKATPDAPPTTRQRIRSWFLDKLGREKPDPVPMAPPVGYQKQDSMIDRVRDMVRSEHLRLAALKQGHETFDEADDFEVGDDFDPSSPFEEQFDPIDYEARQQLRDDDHRAKVRERKGQYRPEPTEPTNGNERPQPTGNPPPEGGNTNPTPQPDSKPKPE